MQTFSNLKSSTPKQLKKVRAAFSRWNRQTARMKTLERKQDTRRKIQLGGLVKKAGLENESTAVLLGLLLEAAEKLSSPKATYVRDQWKIKGDIEFTREKS